jgi:hypothetical protein
MAMLIIEATNVVFDRWSFLIDALLCMDGPLVR